MVGVESPCDALRLLGEGADPAELASRCVISKLWERRDWIGAVSAIAMIGHMIEPGCQGRVITFCRLIEQKCSEHRKEYYASIGL
jgi:hypothetical protein